VVPLVWIFGLFSSKQNLYESFKQKDNNKNLKPNIREQQFEMKKFGKNLKTKKLHAKIWRKNWETKIRDSR